MPKKASKVNLLDHFEVLIDQPNRHYHPNEQIKGDVVVMVSQRTPIIGNSFVTFLALSSAAIIVVIALSFDLQEFSFE
jgi:hypothetical protein